MGLCNNRAMGPDETHHWLRGRRVLITGHTGFKGSWLSFWLKRAGAEVIGLSVDVPTRPALFDVLGLAGQIEDRRGDVRNAEAVRDAWRSACTGGRGVPLLIHMAAQPLVRAGYAEPASTFAINVQGTVEVLEAVRAAAQPAAVVIVTTDKCYRPPLHGTAIHREDDPLGGKDPYSASKAAAELVVEAYRSSFFDSAKLTAHGVVAASVRAGNVIGGGDWAADRLVPDIARAIAQGREVTLRNPEAVRPWQHVLDALSGYLALAQQMVSAAELRHAATARRWAQAWNFGPNDTDGDGVTVRELTELMLKSFGVSTATWKSMRDASAPAEAAHLALSIEKARRELVWTPVWSAREAVERAAAWYSGFERGGEREAQRMTDAQISAFEAAARERGILWAREISK